MKGLLRKDLCMIWSYCRTLILIVLCFLLLGLWMEENFFYTFYPVVMAGMLPVTLISYDERFKWDVYCQTLPVSRKEQVTEKYLISALSILAVLLCSVGVQVYKMLQIVQFMIEAVQWNDLISYVALLAAIALISPSIMVPLIYKLGAEKGRMAFFVVVGIFCVLGAFFSVNDSMQIPQFSVSGLLLIGLAMFLLSWVLSVKIYESKEM